MGYALARTASARGALVTLVSGPTALTPPPDTEVRWVGTAAEMDAAVRACAEGVDVVIMCAAVADFRPADSAPGKLKKEALGAEPTLRLARNPDILAGLGERRRAAGRGPLLIGFAAETGTPIDEARRKLAAKQCDLVVVNDVTVAGSGFGADTNKVAIVGPGTEVEELPLLDKDEVAHRIWDRIMALGRAGEAG
jgi:phosphopantothenoylcysteine decarboxylase/phosphopantothenate--cysteine ligase